MRIRTITGLALAGAAAAVAVGGAAYAGGAGEPAPVVRTVTGDGGPGGATRDCPEREGSGRDGSGAPAAGQQPATPAEAL